jgi:phosphohistidine phosphatase
VFDIFSALRYVSFKGGLITKLYLTQHGEAKSEKEDPDRSLTTMGEEEARRVSRVAGKLNIRPSKVFHSGKTRAKQTAEIIVSGLKISDTTIEAVQGLNPNDDVKPWAERISKETEDLMIVGHLPFLDKLASLLLCGNENAQVIMFRYGAIVCLHQKEDKKWAVRWILTPEMAVR